MRCGDQDREEAAQHLATAFAQGRITREEHDERLESCWRARTFGDLDALLLDLGPVPQATREAAQHLPAPQGAGPVVDRRQSGDGTDRIRSVMSDTRRQGQFRLAASTRVVTVMGNMVVDLTQAVFEADECVLDLGVVMSDLRVVVGPGVAVRDESGSVMSDVRFSGLAPVPAGSPVVVLRGHAVMSSVKVVGPEHVGLLARLTGREARRELRDEARLARRELRNQRRR